MISRLLCIVGACWLALHPDVAAAPRIAFAVGDAHSAAALGAAAELRRAPDTRDVEVRVFPRVDLTPEDREFVRTSDVVLVYTRYGELLRAIVPELGAAAARGAVVAGVGGPRDPEASEQGLKRDADLARYFDAGGRANLTQLLRAALARKSRPGLPVQPPSVVPEVGFFDPATGRAEAEFEPHAARYLAGDARRGGRGWVGVYFARDLATSGQTEVLAAIGSALEARGFNPLFAFGYPPDVAVPRLFLEGGGRARVTALVALTMKIGNVPAKLGPALAALDVPIVNAIALSHQSRADWERSASGLDFMERSWQVGGAELAGAVAPTIVASREKLVDVATGQSYAASLPIPERVERLADRVAAWARLRHLPPSERRLALIYYNYPPGRESVGASYLNVLPRSIGRILERLRAEGYDVGDAPRADDDLFAALRVFGSNPAPGTNRVAELDRLARSGRVPLLAIDEYRAWFGGLPAVLRNQVAGRWGDPEKTPIMTWRDASGRGYFVFPGLRWGKVLLAAQPTRGWDQDPAAVYHDVTLPPHHQYLAFYLWLQRNFGADAMVHLGTHATHEWLPGKEVGFGEADTGEVLVGAVPQLYPYIVDDIGEGLQAKRRAMATLISHLTPPLDRATLNPELREIAGLIGDFHVAREKGAVSGRDMLRDLAARCRKIGVLEDLGIRLAPEALLDDEQVEEIEHHLKRIGEKLTPFGMHTFGVAPTADQRDATADAILSLETGLTEAERARRRSELAALLAESARNELDALVAGLAGRYVPAGPGNDPVRNPDAIPTGRNLYGFDPTRLPSVATYEAGRRLAEEFVARYRERHAGAYPDRWVFNLWGTETSRHEGTMEAQILALMGVRPRWDARGRVLDVELIGREELGRPRVDVVVIPSGLYRDLFPALMRLLDQAVSVARTDASPDNPILRAIAAARAALEAQGVAASEAERLASVRLFSVPPGAYGTGLDHAIQQADSWQNEGQVADVFFRRMSHLFGQGFWGDRPPAREGGGDLATDVLKLALRGARGVVHSRSSNVYGAIDSDDFYQYLGGTALALRQVNGPGAETWVADLSRPKAAENMPLGRFMGRELRSRYLNPKWIEAMLGQGYAGARFIRQVTDNLWGWQVTVPEAVDATKWQELFETYVEDRYHLGIRERFRAAANLGAYQAILDRLSTVIDKGYWAPSAATVQRLRAARAEVVPALADENSDLVHRAASSLGPAPASPPAASPTPRPGPPASSPAAGTPAAPGRATTRAVAGRVLEAKAPPAHAAAKAAGPGKATPIARVASLVALALLALGWWRAGGEPARGRTHPSNQRRTSS